jgi:hypothetical protein
MGFCFVELLQKRSVWPRYRNPGRDPGTGRARPWRHVLRAERPMGHGEGKGGGGVRRGEIGAPTPSKNEQTNKQQATANKRRPTTNSTNHNQ